MDRYDSIKNYSINKHNSQLFLDLYGFIHFHSCPKKIIKASKCDSDLFTLFSSVTVYLLFPSG